MTPERWHQIDQLFHGTLECEGNQVTLPAGCLLVRCSDREAIIRMVAEAEGETQANEKVATVYAQVEACINA